MSTENQEHLALLTKEDLVYSDGSFLNEKQIAEILRRTPEKFIKTRKGKGGEEWETVTGGYIQKILNIMFGWDWDFEVTSDRVIEEQIVVKGRLTCTSGGRLIVKEQYGRKDIIYYKQKTKGDGSKIPVDIGNDFKAAATDALKKCASLIGIAADIYNSEEFKEIKLSVTGEEEKGNFNYEPKPGYPVAEQKPEQTVTVPVVDESQLLF